MEKVEKSEEIKNLSQMGSGGDDDVIKFLHCDKKEFERQRYLFKNRIMEEARHGKSKCIFHNF